MNKVERFFPLTGLEKEGVFVLYKTPSYLRIGTPTLVEFDGESIVRDPLVLTILQGFYHTHPNFPATPSGIDIQTMNAWVVAEGKPLACVIKGIDGVRCFLFISDELPYIEIEVIEFVTDMDGDSSMLVAICPETTTIQDLLHSLDHKDIKDGN